MTIRVGIVDDHQLFAKSLATLIETFEGFKVMVVAINGDDLIEKFKTLKKLPDIMLVDVEMPVMDGMETAQWLRRNHPSIRLVALSMNHKEHIVINMIRSGCCTYLIKDISPDVLHEALGEVYQNNYYNSDIHRNSLGKLMVQFENVMGNFSEKEIEFLRLASTELTYREIADIMNMSERTIDGYRQSIFEKMKVQSRTGMVLEGIRLGLLKL
ncbi:MAG: response regulator transcription factor [Cyclobacteriaceae bacterium]|nr:response regulator transcription factor [Cytophagales bacterium]MBX2899804.1 response regulator transcription factor [Cyclobacteriaceae bacterium]